MLMSLWSSDLSKHEDDFDAVRLWQGQLPLTLDWFCLFPLRWNISEMLNSMIFWSEMFNWILVMKNRFWLNFCFKYVFPDARKYLKLLQEMVFVKLKLKAHRCRCVAAAAFSLSCMSLWSFLRSLNSLQELAFWNLQKIKFWKKGGGKDCTHKTTEHSSLCFSYFLITGRYVALKY